MKFPMSTKNTRSEIKQLEKHIKKLERALKRKTTEGEILQAALDVANLNKAQDFFAQIAPADVVLSEELIRERREEAKYE